MAKNTQTEAQAKDYEAKIVDSTRELTVRERIALKDFSDGVKIDSAFDIGSALIIDAELIATVKVHNEKAQDGKDYITTVVVAKDGTKYTTSSESVQKSISEIRDELADEGEEITSYPLKFFKKDSKNRQGKYFISCTLA